MKLFTADPHYGHRGILDYCNRPFSSVEEMDRELIRRWNEVVKPTDEVFVLGDFSFHGSVKTQQILSQLIGRKVLITGNHDHSLSKMLHRGFDLVIPNGVLRLGSREVFISHYPFVGEEVDGRKYPGLQFVDDGQRFLLHGHVHTAWKRQKRMINVGVDVWSYAPVSEHEILKFIAGPLPKTEPQLVQVLQAPCLRSNTFPAER